MQHNIKQFYFNGELYPKPLANPLMPTPQQPRTGVILRSSSPHEQAREAIQREMTRLDKLDRSLIAVLHIEAYEKPEAYTKLSGIETIEYVREREAKSLSQPVKKHFRFKRHALKRWSEK